MALRKAFPKDRQYDFWNILMYFLVSKDTSVPEKDRNLFGSLAYRLMSKAAEAVPMNPVGETDSMYDLANEHRSSY